MTAIEWLYQYFLSETVFTLADVKEKFTEAKRIEDSMMIDAFRNGIDEAYKMPIDRMTAEEYITSIRKDFDALDKHQKKQLWQRKTQESESFHG